MSSAYFGTPAFYACYGGAQQFGYGGQYGNPRFSSGPNYYAPTQQYYGSSSSPISSFDKFTMTSRGNCESPVGMKY
jgi:hypothetical protein